MPQFLRNKETGREFEVIAFDKAAGMVTLRGPNSSFDEPYDKDRFKANGYELITKDAILPTPEPDPEEEAPDDFAEDDDAGED